MRLDDFDPNSIKVEDQRGSGFSLGGTGGRVGCGSIVIALIAALVFGVDPGQMLGGMQGADTGPFRPIPALLSREGRQLGGDRRTTNAQSYVWRPVTVVHKHPEG